MLQEIRAACEKISEELVLMCFERGLSHTKDAILSTFLSVAHANIHRDIFVPFHPAATNEINQLSVEEYVRCMKGANTRGIRHHGVVS